MLLYMTRQERDHIRYLRNRSERLAKQKEYYQAHKEYYRLYSINRTKLEREKIWNI